MREGWKCGIVPLGKRCKYEPFCPIDCCMLNLDIALQNLRWSLPLVGKFFRDNEIKLTCSKFEPID